MIGGKGSSEKKICRKYVASVKVLRPKRKYPFSWRRVSALPELSFLYSHEVALKSLADQNVGGERIPQLSSEGRMWWNGEGNMDVKVVMAPDVNTSLLSKDR